MSPSFIRPKDQQFIDLRALETDHTPRTFKNTNTFLSAHVPFQEQGYFISELLSTEQLSQLFSSIEKIVLNDLRAFQPDITDFDLTNYHNVVSNDGIHRSISKWGILIEEIEEFYLIVKEKMERLLGVELITKTITHNSKEGQFVGYRLVRPQREDHNPFHKDSWLEYWQDTINVWLPLSGFNDDNGLQFIESSHLFDNENIYRTPSGYVSEGKTYHVPAAVAIDHPFTIIRPRLSEGQGIIFSPYLIHGNGINNSADETRVSLEFRFAQKRR